MRRNVAPSAQGGDALGDGEAALVEGAADDRALEVGERRARPSASRSLERRRCRRRRSPAASVAAAIRLSSSSAGPSIVPSTSIAVQRKRATPRSLSSATASATSLLGRLGPARQRDLAVAGVDRDHDALAVRRRAPRRGRPGRAAPRCRSRPARRRPRAPRATDVGVAQPAADLDRALDRGGDPLAPRRGSAGRPALAPSRSTTCRNSAPFAGPARRGVDRVGVVGGLALVVALQQPHRLAAADVDRRDRGSRGRSGRDRGADPGEVGEQPQAGGARLLGVELDAEDVVALGRAGEAAAVGGAAEQRRSVAGARREGVDEVERASRTRSPRSAASRRSQRTGDQPMWGTLRPPASSSSTRPASRPRPSAPPSSVVDSKSSCRPRQMPRIGTPGVAALGDQLVEARARGSAPSPCGKAPTPGRIERRRRRAPRRASLVIVAVAPTCSSAFSTERRLPIP